MRGAGTVDQAIVSWLRQRSDRFLTLFPVGVLVLGTAVSVLGLSLLAHRNLVADPYVSWLTVALMVVGGLACVAAIFSTVPVVAEARTFRQLELRQTMQDIRKMTWREFEDLVAANYEARGYSVEVTGRATEDGGIDLIARKDKETWLVQCKHYQWELVEEQPLRELLGLVAHERATGGVFVTSGLFTDQAQAFAKDEPRLQLIGGHQIGRAHV